jgi:hypothetical protein
MIDWLAAYNWTEKFIRGLAIGEWSEVAKLEVNNKDVFVTCAKQYIDWHKDAEFSDDYSKIKRIQFHF